MGVIIDELEITSSIPAARLFKAFVLDSEKILPKIFPFFKSFETIEGDGGVGTIKLITIVKGDYIKTSKHRTDQIDEANYAFKYTLIEGGDLDEDFEYVTNSLKIESGSDGASSYKYMSEYHTKNDNHDDNIQEKIKRGKEVAKTIFHAVEAHLNEHPNEYN